MVSRQQTWAAAGLAVVIALGAVGCSSGDGKKSSGGDGKASPSVSASGGATGAGGAPGSVKALPGLPTASTARTDLAGLKVAPAGSMAGYSRDKFQHWIGQGGKCDTRETVLNRDGSGVKQDAECKPVSGKWVSRYDHLSFDSASKMDIDHTVPLANAWRSGANAWTPEQRKAFANDLTHPQLVAVSATSNRAKGDQSPDQWAPPAKDYWCAYAESWTAVKATYKLTVTQAEKAKLTEMLNMCAA
ncbi:HNH endonuclease family protein [Streptomyces violascens]|uniref:HNH endonuclease family protein n=1 Tax=Streptomyces violascens TaxID=67381 RepID=UPI0037A0E37B